MNLIEFTKNGIYCTVGNFYIDPHRVVEHAVITHAHSDHGSVAHRHIFCHSITAALLRHRFGPHNDITALQYGETTLLHDVALSLHPAGHVPGSSQIRVSYKGETWVISGDYKRACDSVSTPFEVVPCDVFVTESTFGLPTFRWENESVVFSEIHKWWADNKKKGKISILLGYSLGKAQRLLAGLDQSIGTVTVHPTIDAINAVLRSEGVVIPNAPPFDEPLFSASDYSLIVAPPASQKGKWLRLLGNVSVGYVSGWMALSKNPWYIRTDARFALSDHADFPQLLSTVADTGAKRVYTTHGYATEFAHYLNNLGIQATPIPS